MKGQEVDRRVDFLALPQPSWFGVRFARSLPFWGRSGRVRRARYFFLGAFHETLR